MPEQSRYITPVNGSGGDVTPEQFDMAQRLIRIEERGVARDASMAEVKGEVARLSGRFDMMDAKLDGIVKTLTQAEGGIMLGQRLIKWVWAPVAIVVGAAWTWAQTHWPGWK